MYIMADYHSWKSSHNLTQILPFMGINVPKECVDNNPVICKLQEMLFCFVFGIKQSCTKVKPAHPVSQQTLRHCALFIYSFIYLFWAIVPRKNRFSF